MAVRMAKLARDKSTGSWASRKVIPVDLREAYGKANEVKRWPSSFNQAEAKAEWRAWLDEVEGKIERLRQSTTGAPVRLTHRDTLMFAGRWYDQQVKEYEDNPGDPIAWDVALDAMVPDYAHALEADEIDSSIWIEQPFIVSGIDDLFLAEGLNVHAESRQSVIREAHDLFRNLCDLMIRRAHGDYSRDATMSRLPDWKPSRVGASKGEKAVVTLTSILEGYATDGDEPPAASTIKAWRRRLRNFIDFLGHEDTPRITPEDIVRWKEHLAKDPNRSSTTITDGYISSVRTILNWGVRHLRIKTNPASGLTFRSRKKVRTRDPGLTDLEAAIILRGTGSKPPEKLTEGNVRARRWIPWICAYTGARVGEISQLRKEDVKLYERYWTFYITPEAGSVKTREFRFVPVHSHLIEQGFIDFVAALPDGPIFYDPSRARGGSDENPQAKKAGERLCRWIRELGVTDGRVKPNHGWRHRVKTEGRAVGISHDALHAIQGHAAASEGDDYGRWKMVTLAQEIEKLPRYTDEWIQAALTDDDMAA